MNIISCVNPKWADKNHTSIICVVEFEGMPPLEFNAMAKDREAHGKNLYDRLVGLEFGPIAEYVPPRNVTVASAGTNEV